MRPRLGFLFVCLVCVGCGSSDPFDYVKASGKVTYEDGSPIPGGGLRLVFVSQDVAAVGNAHPRQGMANADANGNFDSVTSHKFGDGLVPGKHKVFVAAEQGSKPRVPKEYMSELTTPLIVDTAKLPLDIKVPKP